MMKKEITSRADIELLVDEFYKKVVKDEIIGSFFTEVVELDWDQHIPIMYRFWETMLLDNMIYKGNPMLVHIDLHKKSPLTKAHFDRWKALFFATLDEHFTGERVDEAKRRAENMASLMLYKIEQSENPNFIQ